MCAAGAAAHEILAATRKAVISVPLIPALKSLVARNTGDARWLNIRPPHLRLTAAQEARLFSMFDASGIVVGKLGTATVSPAELEASFR